MSNFKNYKCDECKKDDTNITQSPCFLKAEEEMVPPTGCPFLFEKCNWEETEESSLDKIIKKMLKKLKDFDNRIDENQAEAILAEALVDECDAVNGGFWEHNVFYVISKFFSGYIKK